MDAPSGRNRLGLVAVVLAAISVGSYAGGVVWNNHVMADPQASADELGGLGAAVSMLAAAASAAVGLAAFLRALRGGGGLAMAIAGLGLGGVLTALFAIWFLGLILDPGALG